MASAEPKLTEKGKEDSKTEAYGERKRGFGKTEAYG
jgi:hypothetical protein